MNGFLPELIFVRILVYVAISTNDINLGKIAVIYCNITRNEISIVIFLRVSYQLPISYTITIIIIANGLKEAFVILSNPNHLR